MGFRTQQVLLCLLAAGLLATLSGCETMGFYRQAAWGQWQLMTARQPVAGLLTALDTPPELRRHLQHSREIIEFAETRMGLEAGKRYSSYVGLDREYVLWNVFAARPLSLSEDQWCYPIVGCAPYRGYFDEKRARRVAERYAARGYEVYVGGVPAYSTLGWFDDPVLSTFVSWPLPDMANLLLHELAHSRLWVNGDVAFNENFAEFVGRRGAREWFVERGELEQWQQWREQRLAWARFRDFVVAAKNHLQSIYTAALPEAARLQAKQRALTGFRSCYRVHRAVLGDGRYDTLMAEHFNNAFLLSIATYADWLPAFAQLFEQSGTAWSEFFQTVHALAQLPEQQRAARLHTLAQQQISQHADDQHTQQINCQPFLGHGLHAESAG